MRSSRRSEVSITNGLEVLIAPEDLGEELVYCGPDTLGLVLNAIFSTHPVDEDYDYPSIADQLELEAVTRLQSLLDYIYKSAEEGLAEEELAEASKQDTAGWGTLAEREAEHHGYLSAARYTDPVNPFTYYSDLWRLYAAWETGHRKWLEQINDVTEAGL